MVTATGMINPVVKKDRKSSFPSLKKSVEVECMIPIDKNGIRKSMPLLKRLKSPFSEGSMYIGFVKTNSKMNEAPLAKKLVNVYMPIDLAIGFFRRFKN